MEIKELKELIEIANDLKASKNVRDFDGRLIDFYKHLTQEMLDLIQKTNDENYRLLQLLGERK